MLWSGLVWEATVGVNTPSFPIGSDVFIATIEAVIRYHRQLVHAFAKLKGILRLAPPPVTYWPELQSEIG